MGKIHATVTYGTLEPVPADMPAGSMGWRVVLRRRGRQMTVPAFWTGPAWRREPTAADVLGCLLSDAAGIVDSDGFEDWAADCGYDPDSRKAHRIWQACEAQTQRLRRFLGEDFDAFVRGGEETAKAACA